MSIWDSLNKKYVNFDKKYQLTNDEGKTPTTSTKILNNYEVFIKREDLNPGGSHKDRGLAYEISYHHSKGEKDFVISSSGNSAISAFCIVKNSPLTLAIFLSENTPQEKLGRFSAIAGIKLEDINKKYPNIRIFFTAKAISQSIEYSKNNNATLLRGSTDEIAHIGYTTISNEIFKDYPDITDIFIPTSSGTTLCGIYQGYVDLVNDNKITKIPRIHACQTAKINIFSREFDKDFILENTSTVHSIVDRIGHRYSDVIEGIKESQGFGWVIGEEELNKTKAFLNQNDVKYMSNEGCLAVSSVEKAIKKGFKIDKTLVINTGYNDK